MITTDLDRLHSDRINKLMTRIFEGEEFTFDEFFISERAVETITDDKILLNTYKCDEVLALLPFTPVVYAFICPHCIKRENLRQLDLLISCGLVLPILVAPYRIYDPSVREFFETREHISCYEFGAFRYASLGVNADRILCQHCVEIKVNQISKVVEGRRNAKNYIDGLNNIVNNVEPFFGEDDVLLDLTLDACRTRKLATLQKIARASDILREVRTAQALHAPVMLNETVLSDLPENITVEVDHALLNTAKMRELAAEGLKISIPTNIPIEAYIELVRDFQPRISGAINSALTNSAGDVSLLSASKSIYSINREIERLKSTKRYAVLDASIAFYRNNSSFINAALVAGAFGMAGSLLGRVIT